MTDAPISVAWLTGLVLLILKGTETVDWPWVWVLAPFWVPVALVVLLATVFYLADLWEDLR